MTEGEVLDGTRNYDQSLENILQSITSSWHFEINEKKLKNGN